MVSDEQEIHEVHSAWRRRRRLVGMDSRPPFRPPTNGCGYVVSASWKKSWLSAKSLTRAAGMHCP